MPTTGPFSMAVAASLAVASCGSGGTSDGGGEPGATATPSATASGDDGKIDCALAGASTFEHVCVVERKTLDGKLLLVVRHPDGGFRRFDVVTDGRGVVTADGADAGTVAVGDGRIDVKVGADRYHFPATISNAGG